MTTDTRHAGDEAGTTLAAGAHALTRAQRREIAERQEKEARSRAAAMKMIEHGCAGLSFGAMCDGILGHLADRAAPYLGDWGGTDVDSARLERLSDELRRLAWDIEREQRRRAT